MLIPPTWTDDELAANAQIAMARFIEERSGESLEAYSNFFDDARDAIENLIEATEDLTRLTDLSATIAGDAQLFDIARYLGGPPISEDDLKVLAEVGSLNPNTLRKKPAEAARVIETIKSVIDRGRFPWLGENRPPGDDEKQAAVVATASLRAAQKAATRRRTESNKVQEALVHDALESIGYTKVEPRTIKNLRQAPKEGEFCAESVVGEEKADVVVGLWDERTLLIECKVSNSSTNSVKRLNREAQAKAGIWIRDFGASQVVPSAVLGGVFKLRNLKRAQENGLSIWWAHNLRDLTDWVSASKEGL